jgi:hypothetical protein
MTRLSTRCGGRRPKSAKARSRGKLAPAGSECYGELILAPISMMDGTPARRHLDVCTHARLGECSSHFGGRSGRINGRSAGGCNWLERDRRRRGASASERESRNVEGLAYDVSILLGVGRPPRLAAAREHLDDDHASATAGGMGRAAHVGYPAEHPAAFAVRRQAGRH